jgi:hypothetical protein
LSWGKVKKAFEIYSQCKDQSLNFLFKGKINQPKELNFYLLEIAVSEACKFTLFEMLCLHNGEDVKEKVPIYEDYYLKADARRSEIDPKFIPVNTWR